MDLFWLLPTPSILTKVDGQIIKYNRAFTQIVGIEFDVAIQSHIEDFLPIASKVFFQTHLWPLLQKDGYLNEIYFQFKGDDGNKIPILANCHIELDGEEDSYLWVFYIASERQRFEAELIQARNEVEKSNIALFDSKKELEKVNQLLKISNNELERFVYSVSHDIKAPLVTIEGFAKKLIRELSQHLTDKQTRRFERILGNVDHLKQMIAGLLAQSRVMQQELVTEEINTLALINKQQTLLAGLIEEVGARVKIAENIANISANKILVSQCIQNLLSNAIKYRDPTRCLIIEFSYSRNELFDIIHFADNGIGISENDLEKIFVLFEHLDPNKGSGVGLSIVESIMKKGTHHSRVTV